MKTKELPNAIFLQIHCLHESVGNHDEISFDDVTWSEDRIYPTDVEYTKVKSPWISVKDRLPDNQDLVLVRSEYNGKATAYYHGKNSGFITYGEGAYKDFGDITHWMPIPE